MSAVVALKSDPTQIYLGIHRRRERCGGTLSLLCSRRAYQRGQSRQAVPLGMKIAASSYFSKNGTLSLASVLIPLIGLYGAELIRIISNVRQFGGPRFASCVGGRFFCSRRHWLTTVLLTVAFYRIPGGSTGSGWVIACTNRRFYPTARMVKTTNRPDVLPM